jgi:hypothetical protein
MGTKHQTVKASAKGEHVDNQQMGPWQIMFLVFCAISLSGAHTTGLCFAGFRNSRKRAAGNQRLTIASSYPMNLDLISTDGT